MRRSRGAALLLVLIAVAVATILALSFLATQGPASAVATNIDRKAKARQIAESALEMAIAYVNADAAWRTDKASGQWMSGAAMDGGAFDLYGTDEGDGDLSDDESDAVLLVVVATYEGVTHRVSSRVTPGGEEPSNRLLLVVGSSSSPSSQDLARQVLFESWGYTVTLLDDEASDSAYDAAVESADVVYVSEEAYSFSIQSRLAGVTIGVVNEEGQYQDDLAMASGGATTYTTEDSVTVIDDGHAITSGLPLGELKIYASSRQVTSTWRTLGAGVQVLADGPGATTRPSLMVAEAGAALLGGLAAGRRVLLPFGDNFEIDNMTDEGLTLVRQAIQWASRAADDPSPPELIALYEFEQVTVAPTLAGRWKLDETGAGYAGAVQVIDDIDLFSGAYIDAYDATAGPYGGANQLLSTRVFTNSISFGNVVVNNSTVYGDVIVGAGGNPSSVISSTNGGSITGNTSAQSSNNPIPTYDTPPGFSSSLGNVTLNSGGTVTWSSDKHYTDLSITSGTTVRVAGDVAVRVSDDFYMNNADIVLDPGASLNLWVGSRLDMTNGATMNNDTTRPGDLQVLLYGDSINDDFTMSSSIIVGTIHSADDVRLYHGSAIYGSLTNEDDLLLDNSALHLEQGTSPPDAGGASSPTVAADASDLANDGTVHGGPTGGVAGQHGTAFEFNGSSDYVEIPHDDSYLMQAGTFSVWFKTDTTSGQRGLFSKDSSGFDTGGHFSVWLNGSRVEVRMQSTTASNFVRSASGSISAGQWYHIMFAWGEEGMALYLNGLLVDTDPYTGGMGTSSGGVGNYEPIVLGANAWKTADLSSSGLEGFFDGVLDDFRLYNERLSESQAAEIYAGADEPTPFDSEVIVEDTSEYGDALDLAVQDPDRVTWASGGLSFDNDTLAVSLAEAAKLHDAINTTGEFSVEVLLQRASPGTTASPSRIVELSEGSSDANFVLGQDNAGYEARVRDTSTGASGVLSPDLISSTDLNPAADTHLVLSYKDGQVSVYVDGQLDETRTTGGTLNNWEVGHYLMMGGTFGGGQHWRGTLKRVAIYDRGFDATQANNVYNGEAPGTGGSAGGAGLVVWDEED